MSMQTPMVVAGNLVNDLSSTIEIKEEVEEEPRWLHTIEEEVGRRSSFTFDVDGSSENCVYVTVGIKGESSMEALSWALKNEVDLPSGTTVFLVKVDTTLIESDGVANAILELIPVLNIKKIVMGTNKSNLRKLRSKKGNRITDQILQKVPDTCEGYLRRKSGDDGPDARIAPYAVA